MALTEPDELWSEDRDTPWDRVVIGAAMQQSVQDALDGIREQINDLPKTPELVKSGTFSGGSINLDDIFNTSFKSFTVQIDVDTVTPKAQVYARTRVGGVTYAGPSYFSQLHYAVGTSSLAAGQNSVNAWTLSTVTMDQFTATLTFVRPADAFRSIGRIEAAAWDSSIPEMHTISGGLGFGVVAAFTGLNVYTPGSTSVMSGRYRVYGNPE